ncbi:MAG TPA: FecR domain-containing protein [Ramlibacter sp.]|uniref:FecR domain-containing protein n=1 Tax=Ramlibacter sp. TaxID=1917967 RepID=UPI002CC90859|nr:FecR domain-containing protein [Ramlibacter sp.]HVZ43996.1 FecR domain-containing protein [Ramlibacter sp.]
MKHRLARAAALALLACLPAAHAQQPTRHTVVAGDTLMGISQRYLGDPSLWHEVQQANPSIHDERKLRVGSVVVVPALPPGPVAIHVNGKATFTRNGQTRPLAPGVQLQEKDAVDVQAASYVTLRWPEGIVTHLLPGSSLRLVRPEGVGTLQSRMLELKAGTAESQVPPGQGQRFQIRTRLGTAAVRGTGFGVRLAGTMVTDVTEGTVRLGGSGFQPVELPAGSGAVADASGSQPRAVPLLPAPQIEVDPIVTIDGAVRAQPVPGAVKYEFELAPAAQPDATLRRMTTESPVFPLQPLQEGGWRVRVRAIDAQGLPGLPAVRVISAVDFPPPVPGTPADGASVAQDLPGRFVCSEVAGATRYEIEIQSLDAQRDPVRLTAAPYCEGALPQLPPGRYGWRAFAVRELPGGGLLRTQPGPASRFAVVPRPSTPAPQPLPGNAVQRTISWQAVPGARYVVQVALDAGFNRVVSESTVDAPEAAVAVPPGSTFYVRIRTLSSTGVASEFSAPIVLRGTQ